MNTIPKTTEIKDYFIPFEEAKDLNKLGFNEECLASYNLDEILFTDDFKDIAAPLYQQVFKWFRDNYKLYHNINPLGYNMCLGSVGELGNLKPINNNYGTYEEAELKCLKELIKIIKTQKEDKQLLESFFDELDYKQSIDDRI